MKLGLQATKEKNQITLEKKLRARKYYQYFTLRKNQNILVNTTFFVLNS